MADQPFWLKKSLAQLSPVEWESLCDGCGKCCLHKLQDDETEDVFYTLVACKYLDLTTCRCRDYQHRLKRVSECIQVRSLSASDMQWLPQTCAYRLLSENKALPEWHPLVTGDERSALNEKQGVREFAISEEGFDMNNLEEAIIQWV